MARYHINGKGEAGICRAQQKCPFGDVDTEHFSTAEEARKVYEEAHSWVASLDADFYESPEQMRNTIARDAAQVDAGSDLAKLCHVALSIVDQLEGVAAEEAPAYQVSKRIDGVQSELRLDGEGLTIANRRGRSGAEGSFHSEITVADTDLLYDAIKEMPHVTGSNGRSYRRTQIGDVLVSAACIWPNSKRDVRQYRIYFTTGEPSVERDVGDEQGRTVFAFTYSQYNDFIKKLRAELDY